MEGHLQVKNSAPNAEEPVKLETQVQSPAGSERSDGAASPPPNCSICLGKLINTSFTDSCLHQFCFTCLLQWSKIKTECPLCKQTFKSIIHNVRSEEDYDQYHCPREMATQVPQPQVMASYDLNFEIDGRFDMGVRRLIYRTTMTRNRIHRPPRRERFERPVSLQERRRRVWYPLDYRRGVYRHGMWSAPIRDAFGRFRECSAEYYRREPGELNRLIPWLTRELEVVLSNPASQIAYVLNLILDGLTHYNIDSQEFRDLIRPHLGGNTEHFAHELHTFARCFLDMTPYDRVVTYLPQVSYAASPPSSSSSSGSEDSSIRLLEDNVQHRVNSTIPSIGPPSINMPGPSTVGQVFAIPPPANVNAPDVFTIVSSSSSDDDCEVIGYVKPRHERTPEIIVLSSSDPEEISSPPANSSVPVWPSEPYSEAPQPSTSHSATRGPSIVDCTNDVDSSGWDSDSVVVKKRTRSEERISSSSDSDSDSDSTYTCKRSRCRCCHENRGRKSGKRCSTSRKHDRQSDARNHGRRARSSSSSSASESRKKRSRKSSLRSAKRRCCNSEYNEPSGTEKKRTDTKRSRSKTKYSTRGIVRVRKDLIDTENKYMTNESSDSDSSDDETIKLKSRAIKKYRRKYVSSSGESDASAAEKPRRLRSVVERVVAKESWHRSSSESSYVSQKDNSRTRESHRSEDSSSSRTEATNVESKLKSKSKEAVRNSSDSEETKFRPSSQCSSYSNSSQTAWKRLKHKDRHSRQPSSSLTNTASSWSSKRENNSSTKHSDSKSSSNSKGKHKSSKSHKESKHARSQHENKSKSRKRERYIRSSSSSDFE